MKCQWIRGWIRAGAVSSLLALSLLLAISAHAQIDRQKQYRTALSGLAQLMPRMDAATRKTVPALQDILKRVFLDRAHATQSEIALAKPFLIAGARAAGGRATQEDIDKEMQDVSSDLSKMPGVASEPTFIPGQRATPGGNRIGFVDVLIDGRQKTVVEIPAGSSGWSVSKRASEIARRMTALQQNDGLWWTRLNPGQARREYVVAQPEAPSGFVMTADARFAKEWGLTPAALAKQLVYDVRNTFDPTTDPSALARQLETPEETHQRAVEARQQGDKTFSKGNTVAAEEAYKQAIHLAPDYFVAYERLADLYQGQNKHLEERDVLTQAQRLTGLDGEQRREIAKRLR